MTTRDTWALGHCPCCGSHVMDNDEDYDPTWIGEGVRICGWCTGRDHHADDIKELLLRMIATGVDEI